MKKVFPSNCTYTGIVLLACLPLLILSFSNTANAQEEPVYVLEEMDSELVLGQRAKEGWGHFWSAPSVSAINFGYLSEHGYPEFATDHNGSGQIEAIDIEPLSDKLGKEYMNTVPEEGTTDPELLRGIANYVNENYPGEFELKVFESEFRDEYQQVIGEMLPEMVFDVPVTVFTDPEFNSYEKQLRAGEMIWLGVPQEDSPLNHYLAGRSLDARETLEGNFPVDFGDPREKSFQPGKGQIIETVMTEDGVLEYGDQFRPIDIMIALSPLDKQAEGGTSEGSNLDCSFDCEKKTEEVCLEYETEEPECERVCTGWDGDYCYEYETVCEEGDRVCVDSQTAEVLVCDARVKNTGEEETGTTSGKLVAGDKEKHFLVTPLDPGEEQFAGETILGLDKFNREDLSCKVDIKDADETSE